MVFTLTTTINVIRVQKTLVNGAAMLNNVKFAKKVFIEQIKVNVLSVALCHKTAEFQKTDVHSVKVQTQILVLFATMVSKIQLKILMSANSCAQKVNFLK